MLARALHLDLGQATTFRIHDSPHTVQPVSLLSFSDILCFIKMPTPSRELNSETFMKWLWRLETDLRQAELWIPLFDQDSTGRRPVPPNHTEPGYPAYQALASRACSLIMSAAGYSHCHYIIDFCNKNDALGTYDAIIKLYAPRTIAARFGMYRRLISFAKDDQETWPSTINRSKDILAYMRLMHPPENTAEDVISEMAMFALLNTVNPEYDLLCQCLIIENNPSYSTVSETILRYESAFNGKLRSRPALTSINSDTCGFCEGKGHSTIECAHFARHKYMHMEGLSTLPISAGDSSGQWAGGNKWRRRGPKKSRSRT